MVLYDLYINGELRDECRARTPIEAITCTVFTLTNEWFVFHAEKVEVKSSRRTHLYEDVEYYAEDNSLYVRGVRIA